MGLMLVLQYLEDYFFPIEVNDQISRWPRRVLIYSTTASPFPAEFPGLAEPAPPRAARVRPVTIPARLRSFLVGQNARPTRSADPPRAFPALCPRGTATGICFAQGRGTVLQDPAGGTEEHVCS